MDLPNERFQSFTLQPFDNRVAAVGVVSASHDESLSAKDRCLAISDQARVVEELRARLVEEVDRLLSLCVTLRRKPDRRQNQNLKRIAGEGAEIDHAARRDSHALRSLPREERVDGDAEELRNRLGRDQRGRMLPADDG